MFDPFSHYLVAVPVSDKRAVATFDAFLKHIVLEGRLPARLVLQNGTFRSRIGVIKTDNGKEFHNSLFQEFARLFKIRFRHSIAYHPQSNPVERTHRYINGLMRIALGDSGRRFDNWVEALPFIIFSYNKMYIPGTRISPFMLRYGVQPLFPSDLERVVPYCENKTYQEKLDDRVEKFHVFEKVVREAQEEQRRRQAIAYNANKYDVDFEIGSKVMWHCEVGNKHEKFSFHGPYTVTEKLNEVSYKIKDELDGEERIVSVQQIVPFFGEHEIEEISEEDTLEWRPSGRRRTTRPPRRT